MENHANTETNFVWITRLPMYIYDCVCECDSVSSCLFLLFFIWPNVIEIVRWHCHLRLASNIFSRNKLLFSVDRNRFPMNNDYNTWCDLQFFDGSKCRPVSLPLALFQYALVLLFLLIFGTFEIHLSVFKMNDRITRVGHACHLLCSTLNKKTLNNVWTTVNGNTNDDSTNFSRSSKKNETERFWGSTMNFVHNPIRCRHRRRQRHRQHQQWRPTNLLSKPHMAININSNILYLDVISSHTPHALLL